MENLEVLKLELYDLPDYSYVVPLDGTAYKLRFFFNTRAEAWVLEVYLADNTPVSLNNRLIENSEILKESHTMQGYFKLVPLVREQNRAIESPYEIWKYYGLFYVTEKSQ